MFNPVILTDRWGDELNPEQLTAEDRAAIERLLPMMWDELTFIAKLGDEYGILVEGEYDDDYIPTPADIAAWMESAPAGTTFEIIQGDAVRHVFNDRYAAWGWFPEPMASAAAIEAAGRHWLNIAY